MATHRLHARLFRDVIVLSMLVVLGSPATFAGTDIEQRVQRIQHGLLPPVLVQGEPIELAELSARMDALHVEFEHGAREFRILLTFDGRVHAVEFTP